jgi:hypothetical protein
MTAKERNCPKCGAELPTNAPEGLCPQCLMKAGMQVGSEVKKGGSSDISRGVPTSATPPGGFVPPEPKELAEKFPQLEIIELLGQGGMGAVYKARQKQLDRLVALKILPPEVGQSEAFAERFTREARSLAKLNHSQIPWHDDLHLDCPNHRMRTKYSDSNWSGSPHAGRTMPWIMSHCPTVNTNWDNSLEHWQCRHFQGQCFSWTSLNHTSIQNGV